jgi:hypothetical protein
MKELTSEQIITIYFVSLCAILLLLKTITTYQNNKLVVGKKVITNDGIVGLLLYITADKECGVMIEGYDSDYKPLNKRANFNKKDLKRFHGFPQYRIAMPSSPIDLTVKVDENGKRYIKYTYTAPNQNTNLAI